MIFRHTPRRSQILWVIVADRAHARLFAASAADAADLEEIHTLIDATSECPARDIYTDRPGRFPGRSGACVAGDPETDFRHQTAKDFARRVAAELERGRTHYEFGRLMLFAPALFLGALRKELSAPLRKLVLTEEAVEIVHCGVAELASRIHPMLPAARNRCD